MKSSFQTIIIIIFGVAFVAAIAVFSGLFSSGTGSSNSGEPEGTVIIWGVLPAEQIAPFINNFNTQKIGYTVIYVQKNPALFAQELVAALADNIAPDMTILSSELFWQFKDRLYPIPYDVYSERAFRDINVDGAQIFLTKNGVIAVPLLVDPLVVYYNKDMLAAANYALPPRTWTDLGRTIPLFTKRDAQNNIAQSAIALGESQNIPHFRDILSALFLQSGNKIVSYDFNTAVSTAVLNEGKPGTPVLPAAAALDFYTSFANPTSVAYTWNRALPRSIDMFIAGKSAFYVGRASELFAIQAQNPNLNFDVMELFQADDAPRPITFGSFIAAGILKNAPNFNAAYAFVGYLSSVQGAIDELSKSFSLPPTRRDLLMVPQANPYVSVFFRAALSSFAWPDPDFLRTEQTFRAMIQDVTSGRSDVDAAINEANRNLQTYIR